LRDERYERARQRVEALRGFYIHLVVFVVVNAGLFVLDMLSSGGTWFFWPLLGWGIGLVVHAVSVFARGPFGAEWEDRKIRELLAKDAEPTRPAEGDGPSA
jgi:2TM domain-containing protein